MKTLRSLTAILAAALTFGLGATAFAADKYEIDPGHTTVVFATTHLGVSVFQGRFNEVAGTYVLDADPSKASIEIEIKSASVDTNNDKRDEHLKGPDFFNAKQFPKITFKSTSVTKTGDKVMKVTGKMTFLGVTKDVTFDAKFIGEGKDPWGGHRSGFWTEFVIKRSDFGSKFMEGGIGDEITLSVGLEGIKK